MSRNSSGVYTLPIAAFVAGTVIKSADMNTDLSDIATALTQSLATTGVSEMTGPVKLADGTQATPSLTFASDTTTGFYLSNTGEITYVSSGVAVFTMSGTDLTTSLDVTFTGQVAFTGSLTLGGDLTVQNMFANSSTYFTGTVVATAPSSPGLKFYYRDTFNGQANSRMYAIDQAGNIGAYTFAGGQCRLILNGSNLELRPYNGNLLSINGIPREVSIDGPTYSGYPTLAASNTANTFVYIYAYMSDADTMALEMSTVAPTTNSILGVPYKGGDTSRSLVGAAYTDTGGAWADTDGKLWVISYFNRRKKKSRYRSSTSLGLYVAATVTVSQEFTASFRNQFITWDDEVVKTTMIGTWNTSVVGGQSFVYPRIDNGAVAGTLADTGPVPFTFAATQGFMNLITVVSNLSAGAVHYYSPTYVSSANNIQVQTTALVSATSTNTFYTIVEVMG